MYYILCLIHYRTKITPYSFNMRSLDEAIKEADHMNKAYGYEGRYFVVSEKEYEDLWRK